MNKAETILHNLRDLIRLEAELRTVKADSEEHRKIQTRIDALRAPLPTSILSHHDRCRTRGRLSIAPVRHGVCGACHLGLPRARLFELISKPTELNVCDNCGVFIYLADDEHAEKCLPPTKPKSLAQSVKPKRSARRHQLAS
jgi:predicted  nucleic acid-binding Zn-ribbon protein